MTRYKVTARYGGVLDDGTRVTWIRGMEVEIPESVAAWVNRDAEGTLAPVVAEEPAPKPATEPEVDAEPAREDAVEPAETAEAEAADTEEAEKPARPNRKHTAKQTRA